MQESQPLTPKQLGLTIYDSLAAYPKLFLGTNQLERILKSKLVGLKLNQPIRTRAKVVRTAVCEALGYPVPKSFLKTQPRFPGQDFDVYTQKSNNLQIWNEELSPNRRYVLVRVGQDNTVTTVRVVTGHQLERLDTTKTLTRKYQATAIDDVAASRLVSKSDTPDLAKLLAGPADEFLSGLLPISDLFEKIRQLEGSQFANPGADQERLRGWGVHKLVINKLGLELAKDDGSFPDVGEQLLEIKLQTSPTIDLGLVKPGSESALLLRPDLQFKDVRYAIFYATPVGDQVRIDHVVLTTGADFFCFFKLLEGNRVNRKNQIRLPKDFFEFTNGLSKLN